MLIHTSSYLGAGDFYAPGFTKDLTFEFQERLDLLGWDADRCWKELEDMCKEAVKPDMADFDFGHAHRVVEARPPG